MEGVPLGREEEGCCASLVVDSQQPPCVPRPCPPICRALSRAAQSPTRAASVDGNADADANVNVTPTMITRNKAPKALEACEKSRGQARQQGKAERPRPLLYQASGNVMTV